MAQTRRGRRSADPTRPALRGEAALESNWHTAEWRAAIETAPLRWHNSV